MVKECKPALSLWTVTIPRSPLTPILRVAPPFTHDYLPALYICPALPYSPSPPVHSKSVSVNSDIALPL